MMSSLQGFPRPNGSIGVRNHLFALPAVVCANQVGIDMGGKYPALKYIEHQHGCAQIGADLLQTRRVFGQLALHPNVYGTVMVSLGCESLLAKSLFQEISQFSGPSLELVVIQECGGTLQAEASVERWIGQCEREILGMERTEIDAKDVLVGVMFDAGVDVSSVAVSKALADIRDTGVRVVFAGGEQVQVGLFDQLKTFNYAEISDDMAWVMEPGSNALETATGLTAVGAHIIVHFAHQPHAFGSPLAPTLRICTSDQIYQDFAGMFDGYLSSSLTPALTDRLIQVINGTSVVAEDLDLSDFALYRIGPTL